MKCRPTDLNIPDNNNFGYTPVHLAVRSNNIKELQEMLTHAQGRSTMLCSSTWTPLHAAINTGKLEAVQEILKYDEGIKGIKTKTNYGRSTIDIAIYPAERSKHSAIIKELLKHESFLYHLPSLITGAKWGYTINSACISILATSTLHILPKIASTVLQDPKLAIYHKSFLITTYIASFCTTLFFLATDYAISNERKYSILDII